MVFSDGVHSDNEMKTSTEQAWAKVTAVTFQLLEYQSSNNMIRLKVCHNIVQGDRGSKSFTGFWKKDNLIILRYL